MSIVRSPRAKRRQALTRICLAPVPFACFVFRLFVRLAQNGSVVQQTLGYIGMFASEAALTNCQTALQQPFRFIVVLLGELQYSEFCEAFCDVRMIQPEATFSNLQAAFAQCLCLRPVFPSIE